MSAGCEGGPVTEQQSHAIQPAIFASQATVSQDVVFGFEASGTWSTTTSGAVLAQSTTHSQGSNSLSVRPSSTNGYTPIASIPLSTLSTVSPTLAVDVMLPTAQANPYWYGTVQAYINCPSRSIYSQFLSQVELTGKPLNTWNTVTFSLNNTYVTALLQSGYSDLVITIALNVQVPTTGTYFIDNLRFIPAGANGCNGLPNGTSCSDNNACTVGDTCQSGACKPGAAVTCTASDQCHSAGTCSPSTGLCSNPVKPNGTSCNDGNTCTTGDSCQSGVCVGSGTCGPAFVASPATVDFGSLILNGTSSVPVTITNSGTAAGIPSLSLAGTNANEFAIKPLSNQNPPCTPTTSLAPGASCQIFAQFAPLTPGNKSAVIKIGGTNAVTLTGTVPPGAYFSASPSTIDFGSLILSGVGSQEIAVTNIGPVAGTPIFSMDGNNPTEFGFSSQDNETNPCKPSTVLAPGATCHMFAQFAPLTPGNKSAVIKILNAVGVTMTGTVPVGAFFSASPNTIDFGSLILSGVGSQEITVTNIGPVAGTPIFSMDGNNPTEFGFSSQDNETNPCKPSTVLAPGATCHMFAQFVPLTPGAKSAVIKILNAVGVTMTGTVPVGAFFSASPSTIDFGSLILSGVGSQEITVTNIGPVAGTPIFSVDGNNPTEFGFSSQDNETNPCKPSTVLAPGATCHMFAQFVPLTPGAKSAVIKILNAVGVTMTGTVPAGAFFSASPSTIDFGSLILSGVGSQEVTVTNIGPVAGTPIFSIDGNNPTEFNVLSQDNETNPCKSDTVLAPGATCHVFAQFVPLTPGAKSAIIKILNAVGVTVTGTVPPGAYFSAAPSTIDFGSVPISARASQELTVTNIGPVAGTPIFGVLSDTPSEFVVVGQDNEDNPCLPDTVLAPGASCHVFAEYSPATLGPKVATVTILNAKVVKITGFGLPMPN